MESICRDYLATRFPSLVVDVVCPSYPTSNEAVERTNAQLLASSPSLGSVRTNESTKIDPAFPSRTPFFPLSPVVVAAGPKT